VQMTKDNHKLRGPFGKSHVGELFESMLGEPCVVVGAGPSLKKNVGELAKISKLVNVISCLHNFHFLEDNGVDVDYYVTLDAGDITVKEVSEGGTRSEEEYWELTKNKTLISYIGSNSKLTEKWRGKILWFNCPISDDVMDRVCNEVEVLNTPVSTGGNVLGASFYVAKAICAANPIIFVGADFGFSYDKKFHGWNSSYDAQGVGQGTKVTDIFGNRIWTWQSYYNFKLWMDRSCSIVPGNYYNATEGGCLGAYPEGNIACITQMALKDLVNMYSSCEVLREMYANPGYDFRVKRDLKVLF
jgi:hypothetical protein